MRKRIILILAIFIAIFLFLFCKLYFIQVIQKDEMLQKASLQRMSSSSINKLRGSIYDRNLIPLDNNDQKDCIVLIPQLIEDAPKTSDIISKSTGISKDSILKSIKSKRPSEYTVTYEQGLKIKEEAKEGVVLIKTSSRYGNNTIARHILGYVNSDNDGQYGIEKGYNSYLKTNGNQLVGIITDGLKRPLNYGYKTVETFSENDNKNVKLTIDYHFQDIIEKSFDKYSYNGACVMLDCSNGDILAMVSRPNYDQNNVLQYFDSQNKELMNKALYPYNLGSIFKIVIAQAALEKGMVKEDDLFNCPGFISVDGQIKKCTSYSSGGHGVINFNDAFASSCNTVFINVGLKLGYKTIIEYARKFGLGQSIGLDIHGFIEDPGLIQYDDYTSNREIANMSIGQGKILATPLQVANLVNIVANNGIQKKINIVDSIVDNDGNIIKKIRIDESQETFSPKDIAKVRKMMNDVVEKGTGTKANIDEYGGAAGKTSSAETGIYNGDEQIIHAWFGGYFPRDNPKYALAIIIENGKLGSQVAAPLFGEIASEVMKIGER